MTDLDLDAIEARANAARPGPWMWRGNVDIHYVLLQSLAPGRWDVLDFARWGFSNAQPVFTDHKTGMLTRPMKEPGGVRFDVCPAATARDDPRVYRGDFVAINHPDAEFIAAAREDVPKLIARIRELEAMLAERSAA